MRHPLRRREHQLRYQGTSPPRPPGRTTRTTLTYLPYAPQEVDIGLAPDIGSLAFLPKITGNHSLLRELTYTARAFSAAEADKLGLVSKVVPGGRDEVVHEALELAKFIAAKSPIAVTGSKHLITHARDHRYVRCVLISLVMSDVELA